MALVQDFDRTSYVAMMSRFFTFHLYRSQVLFLLSGLVLYTVFPMRFIYNCFSESKKSEVHVEIYFLLVILSFFRRVRM